MIPANLVSSSRCSIVPPAVLAPDPTFGRVVEDLRLYI